MSQLALFGSAEGQRHTRVYNVKLVPALLPDDVYVGRAGHGFDGRLGNRFTLQEHGAAALDLYAADLDQRCENEPEHAQLVASCAGKRLLCFCLRREWSTAEVISTFRPRCHAQILAIKAEQIALRLKSNRR